MSHPIDYHLFTVCFEQHLIVSNPQSILRRKVRQPFDISGEIIRHQFYLFYDAASLFLVNRS